MSAWINFSALWKILVFGLLAGAGLPALFAIGMVALSSAIEAPRLASSVSLGVSASGSATSADCSRWSRTEFESLR